jgi:NDP-sugar pyrophosphorylase family protein
VDETLVSLAADCRSFDPALPTAVYKLLGLNSAISLRFIPTSSLARCWQGAGRSSRYLAKRKGPSSRAMSRTVGILLAGTHGWSRSAFDRLIPRALLPVAHQPLIWYGLSWLEREGVREIAVCGNRETSVIRTWVGSQVAPEVKVSYHQDPMPRGAAGSARDAALATTADTFVIADGTAIPNADLRDLLLRHRSSGACVTVVVHSEARPNGDACLHVPAGAYVFARRAFDHVPARGFCDIKETLVPRLYGAGERIIAYETATAPPRVLDSATYMAVNEWMVEHLVGRGEERGGYITRQSALVHREAFIADDAALVGPVLVGPGARILSGAVVVGPTSVGREATVGRGVLVSRSAVWRRSVIGDRAVADRCIVADNAVVAPDAQMQRRVVTLDPDSMRPPSAPELSAYPHKRFALDFGMRRGRLVMGASSLRLPAAE